MTSHGTGARNSRCIASSSSKKNAPAMVCRWKWLGPTIPAPNPGTIELKRDRVDYWVSKGAQMSERVGKIVKHAPVGAPVSRDCVDCVADRLTPQKEPSHDPSHEDARAAAPNAKAMIEHIARLWWMLPSPCSSISSTIRAKLCWSSRSQPTDVVR